MPKLEGIKRVLVIGSGPIIIGQAAEFDYAGTQACRSLKEEGMEVILVNSNPATIMTDKDIADKVYIEPLTVEVLEHIIEVEKPDSLLPNMGGQAGLNLGMELAESGFLESHGVKLLGTTAETIRNAEGRQEFKDMMERIGEPCAPSELVENIEALTKDLQRRKRSVIRWFFVRRTPWGVPAVVLHITVKNWRRSYQMDFVFLV